MHQRIFFSGLNGLRAIAALAVVFSHTTQGLYGFGLNQFIFGKYPDGTPKTTMLAGFGVSIFFTLSGFLITYLLMEEKRTGTISIRNFYIRRILRIWPLYYLYFFMALVTMLIFDLSFEYNSIPFYVFLLANVPFILGTMLPFLSHYWSLGVEEQFYSFWPWVVKKSNSLLRTTLGICIALIILKTIVRLIDIKSNNGDTSLLYDVIHVTRFHCILIGAVGAILYHRKHLLFLMLTNNYITQVFAWLIIVLVAINKFHVASFIDNELISIVSVALIVGQIEKHKRILNLNAPFFDFIGKISYGIYVFHPLVIFYLSRVLTFSNENNYSYIVVYGAVFAITIGLAHISYSFFEKKFLDMKGKYSTVQSSSAKEEG